MKKIFYFVLSICALLYIATLCVLNVAGDAVASWETWGTIISGIGTYGGLAIIFLFAFLNFFGNPLKIVFFVLLIIVTIICILTSAIPEIVRGWFGINNGEGVQAIISWLNF